MRVYRGIPRVPDGPIALSIGNFDGVHLGHQAMLRELCEAARAERCHACVMTFEPHPREFFAPLEAPPRLSSLREKLELLRDYELDRVYVCRFDRAFASVTAEVFVQSLLHKCLGVRWLLVGDDFRFGANRAGSIDTLRAAGARLGFAVAEMETISANGERVSSTAIRTALARGEMAHARALLGRPYSMSGRVIHGQKLGRKLGFPTANIPLRRNKAPVSGVFAVELHGVGARPVQGAASLGTRPTIVADGMPLLEVHLFDFNRDIHGLHVRVEFLRKLRDEQKYADLESLRHQIALDVETARLFFAAR